MELQISIEKVKDADIPAAGRLMEEMWREHGEKSSLIATEKILAPTGPGYIRDFLRKPEAEVFVAKVKNKVVGVISCLAQSLPAHYKETREVYIDDLCVDVRFRRHGIGTRLVGRCEEFARTKGIRILSAKVWSFNLPSAAMLEETGYLNSYSYFFKDIKA